MTWEERLEKMRKEIEVMTLKQARDIVALSVSHDDMPVKFEKAVKMLLNCADKTLKQGDILDKIKADLHYNVEMHEDGNWYLMDKWVDEILDKYKAKDGEKHE